MTTDTIPEDPKTERELSGAQVARLLGFPSQKLATYVSNPDRWMTFFPGQGATGSGRSRYYTLGDAVVVAMLLDTSAPSPLSQTLATELRRSLATEIRTAMASGVRPAEVSTTVERLTFSYRPRWDVLDTDLDALFGS